jgi:hypothetical protein
MTRFRPPPGGLFRLRGPAAESGQQGEGPSPASAEARDAIRHFVRVLERLDRETHRPARAAQERPAHQRPLRERAR